MKTLAVARKKKGLRSRELAQMLGIDQSLISKFENGKRLPNDKQLRQLSNILDVSFEELMKEALKNRLVAELSKYHFADQVLNMVSDALASYSPRRTFVDKEIEPMLDQIDVLKEKLDGIRSFENFRITEALSLEYTFESNRIEGNTLTLKETDFIVNHGLTIGGKSMREHLEAINHNEAIDYVFGLVNKGIPLTEREGVMIHNLILRGIYPEEAGRYRSVQVMIKGSSHLPPSPLHVDGYMSEYWNWYERNREALHPVVLAAEMHERLVTIHPFIDGNGRTSRLIMNAILLQHGYVIANLKGDHETRMRYYEALEEVQTGGKKDKFIRLIAETELSCLERYLSILK